jgi:hypothetical protein
MHHLFGLEVFHLRPLHSELLLGDLGLYLILLHHFVLVLIGPCLALLYDKFGLLCLLLFVHYYGLRDFSPLLISLLPHHGYTLAVLLMPQLLSSGMLRLLHLFVHVVYLKLIDIRCSPLSLFDLLPCLHLLLPEKGNSVCKQLGVSLGTTVVRNEGSNY